MALNRKIVFFPPRQPSHLTLRLTSEESAPNFDSSPNVTSVAASARQSHFSRRQSLGSENLTLSNRYDSPLEKPIERTISKMSEISRIPTSSDRELGHAPQVPSNLLTSYSRQQS